MQQLNAKQLLPLIRTAIAINRPLMIWGQPGTGKSKLVQQLTKDDKAQELEIRLTQYDSVDLRGIPHTQDGMTAWCPPVTLPFLGNPNFTADRPIYLFLDELPQALPAVQAVAFQLVLDRRIGEHVLMPNVRVIAAGNREGDKAGANRMLSALSNRFIHVELVPHLDSWCEWAWDQDYPSEVIAFLRLRPDLLSTFLDNKGVATTQKSFATPRTWQFVCEIVARKLPEELQYPMIAGCVGEGPGAELQGFLKICAKMPSIDGILLNPDSAPVPDDPATLFAVTAALAQRAKKGNFDAICSYTHRIPPEFAVRCIKDSARRTPDGQFTTAFAKFAAKYEDLFRG